MARVFNITMGTGFALSINPKSQDIGGQLILNVLDPGSPLQQWQWLFMPGVQASFLYNPARNLCAAPKSVSQGAHIVLNPMSLEPHSANTFQVLGNVNAAVRPPADTNLNLNAFGNSWAAGTAVGLWSWSGGKANEVWTSTSA
ncbi:MAG: hypothetical protein J7521_15420 [Caulobacter sp.]|nr:hypothetical protein [Caulobacter sp.]